MNQIIVGIVSAVVSILVYVINSKIENDELSNKNIFKMGLYGIFISTVCMFLSSFASETGIKLDQDIMTGTPNF